MTSLNEESVLRSLISKKKTALYEIQVDIENLETRLSNLASKRVRAARAKRSSGKGGSKR
jgi:hypothetical protein